MQGERTDGAVIIQAREEPAKKLKPGLCLASAVSTGTVTERQLREQQLPLLQHDGPVADMP
jgi:hypothetical protein